jgi:hypothetical protein
MALEDLRLANEVQYTHTARPVQATQLKDLNLEVEVLENYNLAKQFLQDIDQESIPANQVAQVINSIASILKDLVKMQTDLYDAERVKKLEAALINTLKTLPEEQQNAFFTRYERALALAT